MRPCFEKYSRAAAATREIFATYDPDLEACSLDEACLDITDYCAAHGVTGAQLICVWILRLTPLPMLDARYNSRVVIANRDILRKSIHSQKRCLVTV